MTERELKELNNGKAELPKITLDQLARGVLGPEITDAINEIEVTVLPPVPK